MTIDWNNIRSQVEVLAAQILAGYEHQALADFDSFKARVQADVEAWATSFVKGEINADELQELIEGEKDLLELHSLKQAIFAKKAFDDFTAGVIAIITDAITKLI